MAEQQGQSGTSAELDRRLTAAMAAAQQGDRKAYEILLKDCVPIVRRIAGRQGAPSSFVDDVVQDVLVTLHGARRTFDPSRSFLAWITVITQRRTIDLLRKRGRQGSREVYAPVEFERFAAPDDPARDTEKKSEANRLRAAIATLPEGQRQAVETLGLQENSLEEASKLTGRTKSALKVNLHRAVRALRLRLGDGNKL